MKHGAYVALFISITAMSFAAILIVSCDAPSMSIAFYRLLFTTLLTIPLFLYQKNVKFEISNISFPHFMYMICLGLILGAHFSLWVTSLKFTSVASSVILVTAHPMIVGLLAHFLYNERLSFLSTVGIIISITGLIILVYGNYGFATTWVDNFEGNLLAFTGGVAFGVYILAARKIRKTVAISTFTYTTVVYSAASIALFGMCLTTKTRIYPLGLESYLIILLMAAVSGIFGHTLYNWSLKYVRASTASVSLLGEPIGSTLLAFIIPWINQVPSIFTLIGGFFILLGIYLAIRDCYKRYT